MVGSAQHQYSWWLAGVAVGTAWNYAVTSFSLEIQIVGLRCTHGERFPFYLLLRSGSYYRQDPTILRNFAWAVPLVQVLLCIEAIWTKIILHADGSFCVFAISVGLPWELKWSVIPPCIC
jgi:hypothetical protein